MQMQRIQKNLQTQKLLILCLIRQRLMYQQYNYDEAIKLLKKQDDFTKNKDYMDLAAKCADCEKITG